MVITDSIKYIGVDDHKIDLFEGQYHVLNGMAYNSYAIIDEKIAILDSVDKGFTNEWLNNIENALEGKNPDYLIVQHMEPDHSASIVPFINAYPNAKIVATQKTFQMMKGFFKMDFSEKQIIVNDKDSLSLGKHALTFFTAPMVHWPEVMVSYDSYDKVLFSADAFGKFGALDVDEEWACEARRYYFGIVGKYGLQVQALLKKVVGLNIERICPLHGPMLDNDLSYYFNLYDTWSSYKSEDDGVLIAYTSVYGNTKDAVLLLENELIKNGCAKVALADLARCDMAEAVEDAFRYSKIVFATTTYNMDIFPFMREFISHLTERNFQNKTVAFIENGSWAPCAIKVMRGMLEKSKNLDFIDTEVRILSALSEENKKEIIALAKELCK